jgi:hypothetical protein
MTSRQKLLDLIQASAAAASAASASSIPQLTPIEAMAFQLCCSRSVSAVSVLRRLLDMEDSTIDAADAQGNTLLHAAASAGDASLVTLLLSRQPELCTACNAAGMTALDVATAESVRALIRMALPPAEDVTMEDVCVDETDDETLCLRNLPPELQMHILMHLDEPSHLLATRASCRKLRAIADDDLIWERMCWVSYRRAVRTSCLAGTWREVYVEHTLLQGDSKANLKRLREERQCDRRRLAGLERSCRQPSDGSTSSACASG